VTQFAAGCAICGFDLERPRRTAVRVRPSRARLPSLPRLGEDVVTLIVIALLTLGLPLVGVAAAIYALHHNVSRPIVHRALWIVLGTGVVFLLSPQVRFGVWRVIGS
jgi:uncharacterized BrkB/YihY/UPF0761 family membrane protein